MLNQNGHYNHYFLQMMKCNQRLYDNCIKLFMVRTQISMIVYLCNVMYKTFFQLEMITLYIWTFKFVDIFCYKLQIWMWTFLPMEKIIKKISITQGDQSYYRWDAKIKMWKTKKNYFFTCVLWNERSLKIHKGHKNYKLQKTISKQYVCIINSKNGMKPIGSFNKT